ncbi:4513_t:CDS:2, partial [Acaulospora colombiana]
ETYVRQYGKTAETFLSVDAADTHADGLKNEGIVKGLLGPSPSLSRWNRRFTCHPRPNLNDRHLTYVNCIPSTRLPRRDAEGIVSYDYRWYQIVVVDWINSCPVSKNVSEEEFRRHWEKVHGPNLVPLMKKYGVMYYSQTYPTHKNRGVISKAIFSDDDHTLDCDGVATVVFPSAEAAHGFANDPAHEKVLKEGHKFFVQENLTRMTAGDEVVFVNDMTTK